MSDHKLASIQTVTELRPIAGADRIEAASVLGYQTVVKKGEFRPGDPCVWHEPDTIVAERPEYEFLRKQKFRLKIARFKGQVSQGLALPLAVVPENCRLPLGSDVSEAIGIRKYEKPVPVHLAGKVKGGFPSFIIKTDEPNLRSYPEALAEFTGRPCVITQKVDGSSATYYRRREEFGVCSRNLELLEDSENALWKVGRELKIEEALATLDGDYALQGEVHGLGVQGNHLGLKVVTFAAFNLFDIILREFLPHAELVKFCASHGIPVVSTVWEGEFRFTLEELVTLANRQEYAPGLPAEGIVIRPTVETRSLVLNSGRLSAKVISETYGLKYGE